MARPHAGQAESGPAASTATVLVIHPGALGDVLQAVPALRALAVEGPVAFSGQSRLGALLRGLGVVETALPFDTLGLEALFTREPAPAPLIERLGGFRRVISWFGARDAIYAERLRATARRCVIAPPVPAPDSRATVWDHLLRTIGVASGIDFTPLAVPESWRSEATRVLTELGAAPARPLFVVHPGAGGASKLWPVSNVARVIRGVLEETEGAALVHQGPADRAVVAELTRALDGPVLYLIEPDLPLLAAILERASGYLGMDSGVSHLAAAVGAPAVILFPAATRARWAPWSATARPLTMSEETSHPRRVASALIELMKAPPRETA
jgi:heptosyltransferase III